MKFRIFSELSYEVYTPANFVFNIQAAKSTNQKIIHESLYITPSLNYEEFTLAESDARFVRMEVGQGISFTITYNAEVEVACRTIDVETLSCPSPIIGLETTVLPYLFPSRHCQSDKLRKLASKKFGNFPNEYSKVRAISDWIFENIDYITGSTNSGTAAVDTLIQREGVCKDFAHLGIALCRAIDIPARYFTGYAFNLYPPDIHACFEAYIAGHWIIFDPTNLVPLNGLVKIANGKDATEAAVASFFGNTNCTNMNVQCNVEEEDFIPFMVGRCKKEAISYT